MSHLTQLPLPSDNTKDQHKGSIFRGCCLCHHTAFSATYSSSPKGSSKAKLLGELEQAGVKYNKDAVVGIVKNPEGKLTWLEIGNEAAGLKHVVARHSLEFSSWGLNSEDEIGKLILNAVEQGGGKSLGNGVTIYDVTINGISKQLKVVTGNNGFIVTAHPYSL